MQIFNSTKQMLLIMKKKIIKIEYSKQVGHKKRRKRPVGDIQD